MTPRERAEYVAENSKISSDIKFKTGYGLKAWLIDVIESQIEKAVAEERERCAKIAEEYDFKNKSDCSATAISIAEDIRKETT